MGETEKYRRLLRSGFSQEQYSEIGEIGDMKFELNWRRKEWVNVHRKGNSIGGL